ncbi:Transposon TX1 uncharacterized 82 kDa protein ORF 1 [Takifugu flavidus]|uniref:Transposon TX1 uncharacterized 82 kDa protein ORF 1 n=1 Tax=Takifugu flavidus TaxID=433684 RepID=A0A5C6MYV9_9TELE|nr:Transposon TX1 uncharacterized 82 kDa protein ORF 1 [Takifugu flavidus]
MLALSERGECVWLRDHCHYAVVVALLGVSGLEKLTRSHAVKLSPPVVVSVEECSLVVGEIDEQHVVVFVDSTNKADQLVKAGVVINGALMPNELLLWELSRHERVVSPIRLIPRGCKSLLLRHFVSFRRQVSMVLSHNKEELNLALCFRVDEFDYIVYGTTDSLKCFGCGEEGHVIWSCPNNVEDRRPASPRKTHGGTMASTNVEVKGDHLDLRSERLTRELVEQTATRVAETVRDIEDVLMEENSLNVSIKRKTVDAYSLQDKQDTIRPGLAKDQELYRLKKLLLKVRCRLENAD